MQTHKFVTVGVWPGLNDSFHHGYYTLRIKPWIEGVEFPYTCKVMSGAY